MTGGFPADHIMLSADHWCGFTVSDTIPTITRALVEIKMKNELLSLDFNLLKALNALLEERSVTRAAEKLSLTQPAVSAMLTRLRDYFGDPLFVRGQRGMVPTSRASELAGPVSQIISGIAALSQPAAFDQSTARFDYTIAATDYALKAMVLPLMSELKKQAPGIRLAVIPVDPQQLSGQFERGEVDLALIQADVTPQELHSRSLFQERYVCMMRADHPAASGSILSLDDFCQLEHVIVSPNGFTSDIVDQLLEEKGLQRLTGMAVNSYVVLPEVLRISDMIAVVPYRLTCAYDFLIRLTPPVDIPGFSMSMSWHERTHRDPAHQWIRTLLLNITQPAMQSGSRPNPAVQVPAPPVQENS